MGIKKNKKISINQNQKSFFFEDYLETNLKQKNKKKTQISDDRLYILFIVFFSLISIFSISIISVSIQKSSFQEGKKIEKKFLTLRRDIVDRNGQLISRNIDSYHAAIKPSLIKNKETLVVKIRLNFPEISSKNFQKNLKKKNIFI